MLRTRIIPLSCLLISILCLAHTRKANGEATPLKIIAWNVESEGAESDTIANDLTRFKDCQVFALSEVLRQDMRRFADAIGHANERRFHFINSNTGNDDRLQIIFDATRLKLLESRELFNVQGAEIQDREWRHRSPLVAKFRDQETGEIFFLMVNHLARGDSKLRARQAAALREWVSTEELPMIAVGDYNFDYNFETEKGNAGFDEFTRDGIWKWVKPDALIDSNWADHDGDGEDDYPGSILDFAFVARGAKEWKARSRVIVHRGDFPDDERTSDHRPIELIVEP